MKDVVLTNHGPKPRLTPRRISPMGSCHFGQIALDPDRENLPVSLSAANGRVLENLKAILEAGGASLSHVVKPRFLKT